MKRPAKHAQSGGPGGIDGRFVRVRWRVAARLCDRLRGLLGSAPPLPGHALLLRPCSAVHTCGMGYPIDVVFMDRAGRVLRVCSAVPPLRVRLCWRARMVAELAAGEAGRLGLAAGARMALPRQGDERLDQSYAHRRR